MFKVRIVVIFSGDFPGGSNGKASIYNAGDLVLGQEDPLKKKMAILQTWLSDFTFLSFSFSEKRDGND